jgi:GTP-binding protein EngB required for normal cell division
VNLIHAAQVDEVGPSHSRPDTLDSVSDRAEALRAFLEAVAHHLPETLLTPARMFLDRAGQRLSLSRHHTVVALAGASGSGKSSLFNALANLGLSTVSARRPTTAVAHACVWQNGEDERLLDWLGVPPSQRFTRESPLDADDEASLRGLVLLDLPDFDSVEDSHRMEVDRLLSMVDLVIWVLDPQKYADHVVHRQYLSRFHRHRNITVVLLNQADLLPPADRRRCLVDLRQLLDADGLAGVPVLATSAIGSPGTGELRAAIEQSVAARQAAVHRLAGDLDATVADLAPLVRAPVSESPIGREAVDLLADALAAMGRVQSLLEASRREFRWRTVHAMRWPAPTVGIWAMAQPPRAPVDPHGQPAHLARVALAARVMAEGAGHGLPVPWPAAVATAARSRLEDLPAALEAALSTPELVRLAPSRWWRLIGVARWLCVLVAIWGLATRTNALVVAGLAGWVFVTLAGRLALWMVSGRIRTEAEERLRAAVIRVGRDLVEAPVRKVLRSYTEAQVAIADAQ